jgi:adenylate cyclase
MLSPKHKRYFFQIIPFGIVSALSSIIYALLEKGILGDNPIYPSTGNPYNFTIVLPTILSFIVGVLVGAFEILYLNKRFLKNSLSKKIIFKTLIYLILIFLFIISITTISNAVELDASIFSAKVWNKNIAFLSNFAFITILIYVAAGITVSLFYTEVSDNIGQAMLLNFFTGKYHHPIEEERIFMFLDMKASTTIAEKLGHVAYFEMLRMYYADLSDAIIQFGGEIYQYVGDEVVITWKYKEHAANTNCIYCFFGMKKALLAQSEKYKTAFGVVPTFKAGIHLGKVTTGEIGVIKKEITFSGDVLNTAARIQGLCNNYNVDLLVSAQLIQAIKIPETLQQRDLGEANVRGRLEKITVFTISEI